MVVAGVVESGSQSRRVAESSSRVVRVVGSQGHGSRRVAEQGITTNDRRLTRVLCDACRQVIRGDGTSERPLKASLIDFGIALRADDLDHASMTTGLHGSPGFHAPEMLRSEPYHPAKCDCFSLGCLLLELLVGHVQFRDLWLPPYQRGSARSYDEFCSELERAKAAMVVPTEGAELMHTAQGLVRLDPCARNGVAPEAGSCLLAEDNPHPLLLESPDGCGDELVEAAMDSSLPTAGGPCPLLIEDHDGFGDEFVDAALLRRWSSDRLESDWIDRRREEEMRRRRPPVSDEARPIWVQC